ncbi:MAG: hypothetical protein EXS35_15665 [Pedosphaera sp.]|nr:hypothetical protein [Pedosphaera sp.]
MKRGRLAAQIILVFIASLVGYVVVFHWIENRRVVNGPWTVTFTNDAGRPVLELTHAKLGLHHIRISFPDAPAQTNAPQTIEFTQARPVPYPVPYGQCIFQDTLFQPGTVVLQIFGHEIQFMPRVLTIDRVEHPWHSGEVIELSNVRTNAQPIR